MPAFRFKKSFAAAITGMALAVLIHPGEGFAYSQEEQQACTPDAMRLCGAYVPDVDRITVCMIQNRSQLSPGCRAYFRQDPEASIKPESSRRQASDRPRRSRRDDD